MEMRPIPQGFVIGHGTGRIEVLQAGPESQRDVPRLRPSRRPRRRG